MPEALSAPIAYEAFIYNLPQAYPSIRRSTLVYIPSGELFGRLEGMLFFDQNVVLCVQEFLNFELGVIEGYGYEVSHPHITYERVALLTPSEYCKASFPSKEKLYWYDSFPHPHVQSLASTHPHHKHIHPGIKHNRIPAPGLSFTVPNLPFLINEIVQELLANLQS
ncbi:MAG: DUF6516 family protein [Caldilineaceae bacterium]